MYFCHRQAIAKDEPPISQGICPRLLDLDVDERQAAPAMNRTGAISWNTSNRRFNSA
jgi:hypothetical protein